MTTDETGFSFHNKETESQIRENFKRQGFLLHAGAIATIADSASGAAAQTLVEQGASVLTTEFKINFVAPALLTMICVPASRNREKKDVA